MGKPNNYVGDDYSGKDIIIVDDMVKSGETLYKLSELLSRTGSGKIYSFVYHDLTKQPQKVIMNSKVAELVVLDTANQDNSYCEKIVKLTTSKVLSKYIKEMIL